MAERTANSVRVALVQTRCDGEPAANIGRAVELVREAARLGGQIICLPELYKSYYFCQAEDPDRFDLAETVPGPSTEALSAVAKETGAVVIAPIFEKRAAGIYHNSVAIFDADGSQAGFYRKTHIPDDPAYYEKFYFTPGDLGYPVAKTKFGTIGVLICWDQWFPEAARLMALRGAQILFYPTAIGWLLEEKDTLGEQQHDAWETVQRGHAVANGMFVAACNRVGTEGGIQFWGRSFIVGPQGQRLPRANAVQAPIAGASAITVSDEVNLHFAKTGETVAEATPSKRNDFAGLARAGEGEEIVLAECQLSDIDATRRLWPFLRDRRIDAYGGILQRYID